MKSRYAISLYALALTATPACAETLGRLFFTPEQRIQLDYSHARDTGPENNDRGLILNGIVQKHGGKRTAWINGVAKETGPSDERSPESLPVTLPGRPGSVKIKVGQKILVTPDTSGE